MDQTQATQSTSGMLDAMSAITSAHFVLLGVLAVLVVVGIVFGARLAARRRAARESLEERQQAAEQGTPGATAGQADATGGRSEPDAAVPLATGDAAPFAEATTFDPAPASQAAPVEQPAPAASDPPLTQIKGLGPKLVAALGERGISRVDQIAALTPSEAEALDADLGPFRGRITRDRWIEQARLLSAGDRAGYEAQFGKLGG